MMQCGWRNISSLIHYIPIFPYNLFSYICFKLIYQHVKTAGLMLSGEIPTATNWKSIQYFTIEFLPILSIMINIKLCIYNNNN